MNARLSLSLAAPLALFLVACASVDAAPRTEHELVQHLVTGSASQLQKPEPAMQAREKLVERGPAAVPELVAALRDPELSDGTRIFVMGTLGEMGEDARAAVPAVVEFIERAPRSRRSGANRPIARRIFGLWTLKRMGPAAAAAVPFLIRTLDGEIDTAQYAAQTLGAIGPAASDAVPALARGLRHENPDVANACREALRAILALDEE